MVDICGLKGILMCFFFDGVLLWNFVVYLLGVDDFKSMQIIYDYLKRILSKFIYK